MSEPDYTVMSREALEALVRERNTWARQLADTRSEAEDAREEAERWRDMWNQKDNDYTALIANIEDLLEQAAGNVADDGQTGEQGVLRNYVMAEDLRAVLRKAMEW